MRALALLATGLALAAPAHAETRTMVVGSFDKVSVAAVMQVELRQGAQAITVEQAKGDFSDLKLEVRNGTLVVTRQNNTTDRNPVAYRVTVTAPAYRSIAVAAASDVEGRNLALQAIDINVSSASTLELGGSCKQAALNISTGATFDGQRLRCESAKVIASTGADVDLWVSGLATANASTGATLTFSGNPKTVDGKTTLGGTIHVR